MNISRAGARQEIKLLFLKTVWLVFLAPEVIIMSSGAGLYRDALQEIIERISLHKDILRCAAVCRQCRSIVMDNTHRLPRKLPLRYCLPREYPLPLLMQCDDEEVPGKIEFLSVLENKSFTDLSVPEINGKWIAGSCNGWLLVIEILGQRINLLNPLTRAQISLPSLSTFDPPGGSFEHDSDDFVFVRKALVISEPKARNLDHCIVVAIISCFDVLSFCRAGDGKWTNIKGSPTCVNDVISYKGQLHAVITGGALVSFDVEQQRVMLVAGHATGYEDGRCYLVESSTSGDLLLVARFEDSEGELTVDFAVYKLEEVEVGIVEARYGTVFCTAQITQAVKYQWVELESLDNEILFIGRNCSKSVPASLYPDLKGNCIYFTDDDYIGKHVCVTRRKAGIEGHEQYIEFGYDMGIYDMGEKSIRPIPKMGDKLFRIPPVW